MAFFVVSYDLKCKKDEERDYDPITNALNEMDSCHTQNTVWYVSRDCSTAELRDDLKKHIQDRDFLMVVRFSSTPRWTRAKSGTSDWLEAHGFG